MTGFCYFLTSVGGDYQCRLRMV